MGDILNASTKMKTVFPKINNSRIPFYHIRFKYSAIESTVVIPSKSQIFFLMKINCWKCNLWFLHSEQIWAD